MTLFSQRKGFKPVTKAIQHDSIDADLMNYLWNAAYICIFKLYGTASYGSLTNGGHIVDALCNRIWLHYFKKPIDAKPDFDEAYGKFRAYFFGANWYEVYDFLEFIGKNVDEQCRDKFTDLCNNYLEQECSAYRFVKREITEITSETEIKEIEKAIDGGDSAIREHLETALALLSDRKSPDYRNSVKESVSAVESLCRKVSKNDKATLGDALKTIETQCDIHPAIKKGFSSLYGYASDEGGIRHALTETEKVTFADAKFMLVICSAFVNYITTKLTEKK